MKNLDFRSVLIGILGSALIFILFGMRFQDENLGDITVKSITIEAGDNAAPFVVKNKNGHLGILVGFDDIGSGLIQTSSIDGSELVRVSSTVAVAGRIITFTADGSEAVTITTTDGNKGAILTHGSDGSSLVKISADEENNGSIAIYSNDRRNLVDIGSTTSFDGSISIHNRHDKQVIILQGNKNADGAIYLLDRYGDVVWGQTGKK